MAPVNHRPLGLIVAIVTLALDQLIQYTVTYPLALKSRMDEGIEILPIFRLRWLENRGVSMGFFHADTDMMRWVLVGMTMLIAGFVGVWMWRERRGRMWLPLDWSLAAPLEISLIVFALAMSSIMPICTLANGGLSSYSTWPMPRSRSAC